MKSKFSPKLALIAIPIIAAIGIGIMIINKNNPKGTTTNNTSSSSIEGIYEEEGSGTSVSGASTMTSVRTGFLLDNKKMYTFQVGIYTTKAEIIADNSGMRDGKYATYSVNGSTLTIMNGSGVKQSTCSIDSKTSITCGSKTYIKN